MKVGLFYRLQTYDRTGKLVKDTGFKSSHSYVIQFLEAIEGFFDRKNKDAADITGSEEALVVATQAAQTLLRIDAPPNEDAYGLLIGTNAGSTAEDNENINLDTKIADGSGAGQLLHGTTLFAQARVVGASVDLDVTRTFINESGGTITVKEIGIICKNTQLSFYHLLLRDVITDFDVDDTYTLAVVYSLQSTV